LVLWIRVPRATKIQGPPASRTLTSAFPWNNLQIDPKDFLKSFEAVSLGGEKAMRQGVLGKEAELTGSKAVRGRTWVRHCRPAREFSSSSHNLANVPTREASGIPMRMNRLQGEIVINLRL
jgi:hypothetical protein